MLIIGIIITILLIKVISNQQWIDYHMIEISEGHRIDMNEMIEFKGVINNIIRICNTLVHNLVYSIKKSKK